MGKTDNFIDKYIHCIDNPDLKRTRQDKIVLEERSRKYALNNKSGFHITKIKVENCIANNYKQRGCEAILLVESSKNRDFKCEKAFFVELKGCSVGDALKQIENSLEKTKMDLSGMPLFGRIVPSEYRRNKFLTNVQQKLTIKFKDTGGNLIIKEKLSDTI